MGRNEGCLEMGGLGLLFKVTVITAAQFCKYIKTTDLHTE